MLKISSVAIAAWWAALSIISTTTAAMKMDNMLMDQSLESFLSGLVQYKQLSKEHKRQILSMATPAEQDDTSLGSYAEHYRDEGFTTTAAKEHLRDYLYGAVSEGSMEEETAERIASTLALGGLFYTSEQQEMEDSLAFMQALNGPAPASYTGEGNLQRLGRILPVPVASNYFVNGIWGYAPSNGKREYALMCAGAGLSIIDITRPANPFRVQFVSMGGGGIWRDVCLHTDKNTGVSYAYVGAQGSQGNGGTPQLFVFNLSWLSDDPDKPNGQDSNPIPPGSGGYVNLGQTGKTHTINCARGLLFLHTMSSSTGCYVFDLTTNPMTPIKCV